MDEVVFAKEGDLKLLGSRTLQGFGATIDARRKKLVAAGPIPAATNNNCSGAIHRTEEKNCGLRCYSCNVES